MSADVGLPYWIGVLEGLAGKQGKQAAESAMLLYRRMVERGASTEQRIEGWRCAICGAPATCFGSYEGHASAFACTECCGHGNEDGECMMIEHTTDGSSPYGEPGAPDEPHNAWPSGPLTPASTDALGVPEREELDFAVQMQGSDPAAYPQGSTGLRGPRPASIPDAPISRDDSAMILGYARRGEPLPAGEYVVRSPLVLGPDDRLMGSAPRASASEPVPSEPGADEDKCSQCGADINRPWGHLVHGLCIDCREERSQLTSNDVTSSASEPVGAPAHDLEPYGEGCLNRCLRCGDILPPPQFITSKCSASGTATDGEPPYFPPGSPIRELEASVIEIERDPLHRPTLRYGNAIRALAAALAAPASVGAPGGAEPVAWKLRYHSDGAVFFIERTPQAGDYKYAEVTPLYRATTLPGGQEGVSLGTPVDNR